MAWLLVFRPHQLFSFSSISNISVEVVVKVIKFVWKSYFVIAFPCVYSLLFLFFWVGSAMMVSIIKGWLCLVCSIRGKIEDVSKLMELVLHSYCCGGTEAPQGAFFPIKILHVLYIEFGQWAATKTAQKHF